MGIKCGEQADNPPVRSLYCVTPLNAKALNGGIHGVACSAFAGEQCEVNDAIPRPQSKPQKAATPLLEVRNLTKSSMVRPPSMMSA